GWWRGRRGGGGPGSVAGLGAAHRRFGSRSWRDLLAPAIALAEQGFALDARTAEGIEDERERLAKFPASAALFLPGGAPPRVGARREKPGLPGRLPPPARRGAARVPPRR